MSWFGRIFRGDEGRSEPGPPLPGEADRFLPGGAATSFRVVRTRSAPDPATGRRTFRSGVGVSFASRDDAERLAEAQAQLALDAARSGASADLGGYAYLANRKTEPLVETLGDGAGTAARITVNGYGALVLNTARALFVDIDTSDDGEDPPVSEPPRQIGDALGRHEELRFRIYRTRGGWRLLCTNEPFDPASAEAESLLVDLGADPKYVVLCRVQRSFRARLTPKPWRARYRPREIAPGEGVARADVQRYVDRTWRYATARHVGGAGRDETPLEVWPIVEYHDRWTQATSGKPLA
jgi:hypothetical protein